MTQVGRRHPTIDDPKVVLLLQALSNGNYVETACAFAGLAPSTVHRWLQRGRAEKERQEQGIAPDPQEAPYIELCNAVEKARATAVIGNMQVIQQAARAGQWQAAAWFLERTMPQQYGRRIQADVQATVSVEDLQRRMLELLSEPDSGDLQEADS
jgi:hypothetical protein